MSNLTGLVDNVYFEESRKILEKHSFGSVTDAEKNYWYSHKKHTVIKTKKTT